LNPPHPLALGLGERVGGRPALTADAVERDDRARSIHPVLAVDEDPPALRRGDNLEDPPHARVVGTAPDGQRHVEVVEPQRPRLRLVRARAFARAAQVDDRPEPEFGQPTDAARARLAAAEQSLAHLTESRQPGLSGRLLRGREGGEQQQR
jgi:hypothetical protein